MKLYEVPRNSKVRVLETYEGPPGAPTIEEGDIIDFGHVDGMYSYCHKDGVLVHLVAWAEVELIEDDLVKDVTNGGMRKGEILCFSSGEGTGRSRFRG